MGASACCHNGNVYVFGGLSISETLCTMEVLSNAALSVGEVTQWYHINLAGTALIPKSFCIMQALNTFEIAIMGGIGENDDGETGVLSDVCLVNVNDFSV